MKWGGACAAAFGALLMLANLPFYAGSSLGASLRWRMEHARLTVERSTTGSLESFFIAPNAEGLRIGFELDVQSWTAWRVTIPLWAPLMVIAAGTAWAWRAERGARRDLGACATCGYARAGLPGAAACPECGRAPVAR